MIYLLLQLVKTHTQTSILTQFSSFTAIVTHYTSSKNLFYYYRDTYCVDTLFELSYVTLYWGFNQLVARTLILMWNGNYVEWGGVCVSSCCSRLLLALKALNTLTTRSCKYKLVKQHTNTHAHINTHSDARTLIYSYILLVSLIMFNILTWYVYCWEGVHDSTILIW